jgi:MFS family permease
MRAANDTEVGWRAASRRRVLAQRPSAFAPLRNVGFRLLWTSSLLWNFGRWIDILVAGWLALQLTDSAWLVALIGFYRNAPIPIFGAFAGVVADRYDRRRLILAAQFTNILVTTAVASLLLLGRLEYWHLAAANLLLGLAWSVEWPCRRALMPDLVGRDEVLRAIVLDSYSMNLMKVFGPIIGGSLLAILPIADCYLLIAAIYLLALLPIVVLRVPQGAIATPAAASLRFIAEGLAFCGRHPPVRGVLLITILMNCFAFPYVQLLSVFARDVLGVGPFELGLLAAGDGAGSLVGLTILVSASQLRRPGWLFVVGSAGFCLSLFGFAVSPLFVASIALLVAAGICHSTFSTFQSTIILGAVDAALRGRAMGVLTLAIGSAPLGMLLMGAVAAALTAPWAVGLCAATGTLLIAASAAATPGLLAYEAPTAEPERPADRPAPATG